MKREIKFRAWHGKYKGMYGVGCLDFFYKKAVLFIDEYYDFWVDFDEIELMQFTNFLDKNGKEIYEGDVVKDEFGRIMKIGFWNCSLCFIAISKTNFHHANIIEWVTNENFASVEVIGNVYENPELLEKNNLK